MISVIIPTYRPQAYIWECLLSLATQTLPKNLYEIIIVLNGCNEPFHSQIQQYIINHLPAHQVQLIQTDTGGVSNARNIGLNVAKGEYISFIDDDDFVSETYLEELYKKASPYVISLSYPYAFDDGKLELQKRYDKTSLFNKYLYHGLIDYKKCRSFFSGPCMKLIPRDIIGTKRFNVNFKNGEDSLFMFLISDKFGKVNLTSTNAIYYRRFRGGSAQFSKRSTKEIINNQIRMILEYCKIYFSNITDYNFFFFFTRILATFKASLYSLLNLS